MTPYGCHNSERKHGYYAPKRVFLASGGFIVTAEWIDDKSSKECRYDNRQNDKLCEGCKK